MPLLRVRNTRTSREPARSLSPNHRNRVHRVADTSLIVGAPLEIAVETSTVIGLETGRAA